MNPGLDAPAANVFGAAVQWLDGTLLGTVATVAGVIGVASVGFLLMTGRMDVRRAAQVVFGCFMLFGASSIAAGIVHEIAGATATPPHAASASLQPIHPTSAAKQVRSVIPIDPYAGAAMPTR